MMLVLFIGNFIKKRIIEIWKNANYAVMIFINTVQSITVAINKSFSAVFVVLKSAQSAWNLALLCLDLHNVENATVE